jgi:protein-tyrosine phosphatase
MFATTFTPKFRIFVQTVLNANGDPVLWHCTAGKDRTGFAAAILLRLLGVDQQSVFEDYLLSNRYIKVSIMQRIFVAFTRGPRVYKLLKPLLGVQRQWLEIAFDALDREWGNFQIYATKGLGLTPGDIQKLQDLYLE